MSVLFDAMMRVLPCRSWKSAFEMAGALGRQTEVNGPLLRALEWEQAPTLCRLPPSLKDASSIFPLRRRLNVSDYIYWHKNRGLPAEVRRLIPLLE